MAYEYVYDARQVDLKKIAYDFEYELDNWPVDPHLYQELVAAIEELAADASVRRSAVSVLLQGAELCDRLRWPESEFADSTTV